MPLSAMNWSQLPTTRVTVGRHVLIWFAIPVLASCTTAHTPVVLDGGSTTDASQATPIASADVRGPLDTNARVVHLTDGDTVTVRFTKPPDRLEPSDVEANTTFDSTRTTGVSVRLIGIDTPESKRPNTPIECFARESGAALGALIPVGTDVRIELDVEPRDHYGRVLGYVFRSSDGLFVNHEMVRAGMAAALTYPPNVAHSDQFTRAARGARENRVGLWSKCESEHEPSES